MSQSASQEALELSNELLADLELSRLPLSSCFMKASRLARLLGDSDALQTFQYELEGYPSTPDGITPDIWALAEKANRVYQEKDTKTEVVKNRCYINSIGSLESTKTTAETRLSLTELKSVSISSDKPEPICHSPNWKYTRKKWRAGNNLKNGQALSRTTNILIRLCFKTTR